MYYKCVILCTPDPFDSYYEADTMEYKLNKEFSISVHLHDRDGEGSSSFNINIGLSDV